MQATQPSSMYPMVSGAPTLREVVSTKGIGAAARPASRTGTPQPNKPPHAPPRRSSHEEVSQTILSVSSEDTEFNTLSGATAGVSALAMLTSDNNAHAEASTSSQLGSIANPLASSSALLAATTSAPAAAATESERPDAFDESSCVEATVHDVQRGMSRNYRLTLKLNGSDKQLCLRIGDTEGSSIAAAFRNTATSRCAPLSLPSTCLLVPHFIYLLRFPRSLMLAGKCRKAIPTFITERVCLTDCLFFAVSPHMHVLHEYVCIPCGCFHLQLV